MPPSRCAMKPSRLAAMNTEHRGRPMTRVIMPAPLPELAVRSMHV
jgi:hypothetical protein